MVGQLAIIEWYRKNQKALNIDDMNPYDERKFFTPLLLAVQNRKLNIVNHYIENDKEDVWNKKTYITVPQSRGWTSCNLCFKSNTSCAHAQSFRYRYKIPHLSTFPFP